MPSKNTDKKSIKCFASKSSDCLQPLRKFSVRSPIHLSSTSTGTEEYPNKNQQDSNVISALEGVHIETIMTSPRDMHHGSPGGQQGERELIIKNVRLNENQEKQGIRVEYAFLAGL